MEGKELAMYTNNMRLFMLYGILSAVEYQQPAQWVKGKAYNIGEVVQSDNKIYVATTSGNSGDVAPTHTSGIITLNKVSWLFQSMTMNNNNVNSNLYLTLGGSKAWANEALPPEPKTDDATLGKIKKDLFTLIKLDSANMRIGLKRVNWVQSMIFDAYDVNKTVDNMEAYKNPFYVITSTYDIYLCIDNNNGAPSLIEPTGKSVTNINTTDGYIWKYMASVETGDISQFGTPDFVPISVKSYNDGSEQWKVQQSARSGSISKFENIMQSAPFTEPTSYKITSPTNSGNDCVPIVDLDNAGNIVKLSIFEGGQNYDEGTYITIFEEGVTGEGAQLKATITDGVITNVDIINGGKDYAIEPKIFIIGDGVNAELEATINSVDGAISNVDIVNGGEGFTVAPQLIVGAGERVAIAQAVLSPSSGIGHNVVSELGVRTIIIGNKNSPALSPYLMSGNKSTYRQISLISNVKSTNNTSPPLLIGDKHEKVKSTDINKYDGMSGFVIWTSNNKPITRTETQEEYIKIALFI